MPILTSYIPQRQLLKNWCWASVTCSVALYYDENSGWRQNQLVAHLLNNPQCALIDPSNAANAPFNCNKTLELSTSLSLTGNYADEINRPLDLQEIAEQIDNEWPVCCQILWPGFQLSHFVTIYGYSGQRVLVGDPDHPVPLDIPYQELRNNYRTGGQWIRTIGTQAA